MRIGIIAEGFSDILVVKSVLKALTGIEMSEMHAIRPIESFDETDLAEMNFSNWQLVLESCKDESLIATFFEMFDGDTIMVVHLDTAERGEVGYDIIEPQRTGHPDWKAYSNKLRDKVRCKVEALLPERFRDKVAYAIAIEETDAWLIPLFDSSQNRDTSSYVKAKEKLRAIISNIKKNSKYIDTKHNNLDYGNMGSEFRRGLKEARKRNESLNLFCIEVSNFIND